MSALSVADHHTARTASLARIHRLLAVQSLVVILVSVNRLGPWTEVYVAGNEFLRWVDLLNMLVLPLISLTSFLLLKEELEQGVLVGSDRSRVLLNLAFVFGIYLLGAGYGAHEVTNYLNSRFCDAGRATDQLCRIIIFNDDEFSHWVFFAGFVILNLSLLLLQIIVPYSRPVGRRDALLLWANGLFIGLGVFANLAFEEIELDLYIILLLALISVAARRIYGRQPLIIYFLAAYVLGLAATGVYRLLA